MNWDCWMVGCLLLSSREKHKTKIFPPGAVINWEIKIHIPSSVKVNVCNSDKGRKSYTNCSQSVVQEMLGDLLKGPQGKKYFQNNIKIFSFFTFILSVCGISRGYTMDDNTTCVTASGKNAFIVFRSKKLSVLIFNW